MPIHGAGDKKNRGKTMEKQPKTTQKRKILKIAITLFTK